MLADMHIFILKNIFHQVTHEMLTFHTGMKVFTQFFFILFFVIHMFKLSRIYRMSDFHLTEIGCERGLGTQPYSCKLMHVGYTCKHPMKNIHVNNQCKLIHLKYICKLPM